MKHLLTILVIIALVVAGELNRPDHTEFNAVPVEHITDIALTFANHRETTLNRSPLIDYWNSRLGLPLGSDYCATFVSFVLDSAAAHYPAIRSGWARDFITPNSIPAHKVAAGKQIPPGYLAVWKRGNSRTGHVEIVIETWQGYSGKTIGANTSPPDKSFGELNGVFVKNRHIDRTASWRLSHFTPTY